MFSSLLKLITQVNSSIVPVASLKQVPLLPLHLLNTLPVPTPYALLKLQWTLELSRKDVTYRAAFVQGNSRKINSFEDVFKGNSLAGTILEEYYLKRK